MSLLTLRIPLKEGMGGGGGKGAPKKGGRRGDFRENSIRAKNQSSI